MSATTNPSFKKTNIRRGITPDDIHRQQHEFRATHPPSGIPNRPPPTPAEKAAKEAKRAARAAKRAEEAAKEAKAFEEQKAAEENAKKTQQQTMSQRYLKREPLIKLKDYTIYVISESDLKEFIRDVPVYPVNNPLDYHHWRQIAEGCHQITSLDNCINVVEYDDGSLQILDGQHRKHALMSLPDSVLLKKELVIHKYRSDIYNSERTIKLFNKFNTVKPFKIEHDITIAILTIINRLRADCKGFGNDAIKHTDNDTARQPSMSEKQFSNCLEPLLNDLGPGNYEITDVVRHINNINQEYAVQFDKENPNRLFKGSDLTKNSKKMADMRRIQFYLNTELSKSEWPKRLLEKLRA